MHQWQLQDAKNRLSEVVNRARDEGPQLITRRGKEAAVVLSIDAYRRLRQPETSFVEFLESSPLRGLELSIERDDDPGRDVDL